MEHHLPPSNSWWHWPALIGATILLLMIIVVMTAPLPKTSLDPVTGRTVLTQDEIDRELKYCHDKKMTTAHYPSGGAPIEKIWCLMEVPR
jgi:hypothetical protein